MFRVLLFVFLIVVELFAYANKDSYVRFETGASYLFIAKDKNGTLSIIDDSYSLLKDDGSYCYLKDDIYKKFTDFDNIPDKYCQNTPPYKNIIKILNPVEEKKRFYPSNFGHKSFFDPLYSKPFDLPDDTSNELYYYLSRRGVIENKTKDINETFLIKKNRIDLNIKGSPQKSKGFCSAMSSNILSIKINNTTVLKDFYLNSCFPLCCTKRIDIDTDKKLVIFHLYKSVDDEKIILKVPFLYFKIQKAIEWIDEDTIGEIEDNIDFKSNKFVKKDAGKTYLKDCKSGDMRKCYIVGVMYSYGYQLKQSNTKALEFYNKACDGGFGDACYNLAEMYSYGYGVKEDRLKANRLYKKACENGSGEACYKIGNRIFFKDRDVIKARSFFKKACDEGNLKGCSAPIFNINDENVWLDESFLKASCDNAQMFSCYNLANIYSEQFDINKTKAEVEIGSKKLINLFQKACDGGVAKSCMRLGILFNNGFGVTKDKKRAINLYKKACDMGNMTGCFNLGLMYDGYGLTKDATKAKKLYKKACKGGNKNACKFLDKLVKQSLK